MTYLSSCFNKGGNHQLCETDLLAYLMCPTTSNQCGHHHKNIDLLVYLMCPTLAVPPTRAVIIIKAWIYSPIWCALRTSNQGGHHHKSMDLLAYLMCPLLVILALTLKSFLFFRFINRGIGHAIRRAVLLPLSGSTFYSSFTHPKPQNFLKKKLLPKNWLR